MIVHAAAMFGCHHRYLVLEDDGLALFVCESCGHRTDMLPLQLDAARGEVVDFPGGTIRTLAPLAAASARASSARQRRG